MELARFNMVEQQVRPWDVLDARVLDLMKKVKRELFVPAEHQALAFMDMEIPLGHGVSMWQPKLEARALQELNLRGGDSVLEVGTGSGYLTAMLARLVKHVTSVEIVSELAASAAEKLAACKLANVSLHTGDAAQGWAGEYDAIILTGSVPVLPEAFLESLKIGGRLFAIVGDAPVMDARRITCVAPGTFETVSLFETNVAPLQNAIQPSRFTF